MPKSYLLSKWPHLQTSVPTNANYNLTCHFKISLSLFFSFSFFPFFYRAYLNWRGKCTFSDIRGTQDSFPQTTWPNGYPEEGISREIVTSGLWLMGGCPRHIRECGRTGKTWVLLKLDCLSIYEGIWWVISTLDNPFLSFRQM